MDNCGRRGRKKIRVGCAWKGKETKLPWFSTPSTHHSNACHENVDIHRNRPCKYRLKLQIRIDTYRGRCRGYRLESGSLREHHSRKMGGIGTH